MQVRERFGQRVNKGEERLMSQPALPKFPGNTVKAGGHPQFGLVKVAFLSLQFAFEAGPYECARAGKAAVSRCLGDFGDRFSSNRNPRLTFSA